MGQYTSALRSLIDPNAGDSSAGKRQGHEGHAGGPAGPGIEGIPMVRPR